MSIVIFTQAKDSAPFCFLYTKKRTEKGMEITGIYTGHEWKEGDIITKDSPARYELWPSLESRAFKWQVTKVIEQRDPKGKFKNPEEAKNSFFHLDIQQVPV